MSYREERDTMGTMQVPSCAVGRPDPALPAKLQNFRRAYPDPIDSRACAGETRGSESNCDLGLLDAERRKAIIQAADEVTSGRHDAEFPLVVWQTGSGTQTNMNMNEVLANRASELLGGGRGAECRVHPNDDVNKGHLERRVSLSDACGSGMLDRATIDTRALLTLKADARRQGGGILRIVKIGRTHLQDATPLTLGQEFSGYVSSWNMDWSMCTRRFPHLHELALGGTAVGTGLNAHARICRACCRRNWQG